jgi:hypothetical protein
MLALHDDAQREYAYIQRERPLRPSRRLDLGRLWREATINCSLIRRSME